jgi:GNAT superfamily N-acetyltransferase
MADELPPRPGTQSIPGGRTRCFTKVGASGQSSAPADVIAREGLRIDKATTYQDMFGDFKAIWAMIGAPPDEVILHSNCVVEFHAPTDEVQASAGSLSDGAVVSLGRDIPPSEFVAVYEKWHGLVWHLLEFASSIDTFFDPEDAWMWKQSPNTNTFPEDVWQKALAYVRANRSRLSRAPAFYSAKIPLEVTSRPLHDPFVRDTGAEIRLTDDGLVYDARSEGAFAGYLMLRQRLSDGVWEVWRVHVYESFQRQGVATALLAQARADLGRVDHSPEIEQTDDGKAWIRTVGAADDGPVCPRCGAPEAWNMHFGEGELLYRGIIVETTEDFATDDPVKLAAAWTKHLASAVGEHFSKDSHRAINNFGLPGHGKTGYFIAIDEWHCEDTIPVSGGYAYENEVAFRRGATARLHQLRVYPDPAIRQNYDKWDHKWNIESLVDRVVNLGQWTTRAKKKTSSQTQRIPRPTARVDTRTGSSQLGAAMLGQIISTVVDCGLCGHDEERHSSNECRACKREDPANAGHEFMSPTEASIVARLRLEVGGDYQVVKPGAYLEKMVFGHGSIGFEKIPLAMGDFVVYRGQQMGPGGDNVNHDLFENEMGQRGIFNPNSWGSADTSYLDHWVDGAPVESSKTTSFSAGDKVVLTEDDRDEDAGVDIPAGTKITIDTVDDGLTDGTNWIYTTLNGEDVVVDPAKVKQASKWDDKEMLPLGVKWGVYFVEDDEGNTLVGPFDTEQEAVDVHDGLIAEGRDSEDTWVRLHEFDKESTKTSKDYDQETRDQLAEEGNALPDGSFPIKDCGDVDDAINRAHQGKDPEAARALIKRRWKELDCGGTKPFTSQRDAALRVFAFACETCGGNGQADDGGTCGTCGGTGRTEETASVRAAGEQPRERAVPCAYCQQDTWNNSGLCDKHEDADQKAAHLTSPVDKCYSGRVTATDYGLEEIDSDNLEGELEDGSIVTVMRDRREPNTWILDISDEDGEGRTREFPAADITEAKAKANELLGQILGSKTAAEDEGWTCPGCGAVVDDPRLHASGYMAPVDGELIEIEGCPLIDGAGSLVEGSVTKTATPNLDALPADYRPSEREFDNLVYLALKYSVGWAMRSTDKAVVLSMTGDARGPDGIRQLTRVACEYAWDHLAGEPDEYTPEQLVAHVLPVIDNWYATTTPDQRASTP